MKPISRTAFYCCGIRMQDAEGPAPVCGDTYARLFMDEQALDLFEDFKNEVRPNASNVARHRIIDDILRDELAADPGLLIVIIGAGFDTRAYRLGGGNWVELDEPQLIEYKDERLPVADCANPLRRIAIDFAGEALENKLAAFASGEPVVIVIEGVFMYLEREAIRTLLSVLQGLFPRHRLVCDLMTRTFFERYAASIHKKLAALGTSFRYTPDRPEEVFLDTGYQLVSTASVVETLVRLRGPRIWMFLLKTLLRALAHGYRIHVFETRQRRLPGINAAGG
ncbi:MAG: class I SAM-dependent methyltransferase [Chromatiales bacterium]